MGFVCCILSLHCRDSCRHFPIVILNATLFYRLNLFKVGYHSCGPLFIYLCIFLFLLQSCTVGTCFGTGLQSVTISAVNWHLEAFLSGLRNFLQFSRLQIKLIILALPKGNADIFFMGDRILLSFFRLYILNSPPMTLKPYALHRTQQLTNIQALQHSLLIHSNNLDCQSSNLLSSCQQQDYQQMCIPNMQISASVEIYNQ